MWLAGMIAVVAVCLYFYAIYHVMRSTTPL